jgi:putative aldouronate transport system substrate-binding protein
MLKVIKEKEPNIVPLGDVNSYADRSLYNRGAVSGTIMKEDGSGFVSLLEQPSMLKYFQTVRKYYLAGYIPKDAPIRKEHDRKQDFVDFGPGKPYVEIQVKNQTDGMDWIYQPFGKPVSTGGDLSGSMMAISNGSKDPERALQFYNMFYSDSRLVNLIDYGIEGKHYVKVNDNTVDYAPGTENGTKSGYNLANPWMFGNQFLSYLFKGEAADKWQKFEAFNKDCELMPGAGFMFNSEPVKTQVGAVGNVWKQFAPTINNGAADFDSTLAKFKAKLKEAGLEEILAEMNKQYDAFKAGKH